MNLRSLFVATVGLLSALSVTAVELDFTHAYGEVVDRGDVSAHVRSTDDSPLECAVSQERDGNRITLTTRKLPRDQTGEGVCLSTASVVLGSLPMGTYEVTARVRSVDGAAQTEPGSVCRVRLVGRAGTVVSREARAARAPGRPS